MNCGFYEKEITPPLGADMPGCYSHRYAQGVTDRLYVKAAVFEGEQTAAIVAVDAVELNRGYCDAITARAAAMTGIPAEHIAVCATHTHWGIPSGDDISDADVNYMEVFCRLAADCVTLAWQRRQPCTLRYGLGREERLAFNRDYRMKDGAIVTNPGKWAEEIEAPYSGIDPDLPVLTAYDGAGKPLGHLYTYALHQCTAGSDAKGGFTGDFSSEVARQMKGRFGQEFVSVYLPGCSGDINHIDFIGGGKRRHIESGRILAEELLRAMEAAEPLAEESVRVKRSLPVVQARRATSEQLERARYIAEDPQSRREKYDMTGQNASLMLLYEERMKGAEAQEEMPVHTMQIGGVWLFALPCELYHQYGLMLKEGAPGGKWLIAELSNTEGGYVTVPELMGTDIYPAQLCYGARLEPEAGKQMVEVALEAATELLEKGKQQ